MPFLQEVREEERAVAERAAELIPEAGGEAVPESEPAPKEGKDVQAEDLLGSGLPDDLVFVNGETGHSAQKTAHSGSSPRSPRSPMGVVASRQQLDLTDRQIAAVPVAIMTPEDLAKQQKANFSLLLSERAGHVEKYSKLQQDKELATLAAQKDENERLERAKLARAKTMVHEEREAASARKARREEAAVTEREALHKQKREMQEAIEREAAKDQHALESLLESVALDKRARNDKFSAMQLEKAAFVQGKSKEAKMILEEGISHQRQQEQQLAAELEQRKISEQIEAMKLAKSKFEQEESVRREARQAKLKREQALQVRDISHCTGSTGVVVYEQYSCTLEQQQ